MEPHPTRAPAAAVLAVVIAAVAGAGGGALAARDHRPTTVVTSATAPLPPAPPTGASGVADVVLAVSPSVVAVHATIEAGDELPGELLAEATGTGFVIRSDGVIATAAHVIDGAWSVFVTTADGHRLPARILGVDSATDLAVLRVERDDLSPVTFGQTSAVRVGEPAIAVGHALGLGTSPTVSVGVVSALERQVAGPDGTVYDHLVQTDAAINTGHSGGPLLNRSGEVIGINTSRITADDAEGLSFAICTDHALPTLDALLAARPT